MEERPPLPNECANPDPDPDVEPGVEDVVELPFNEMLCLWDAYGDDKLACDRVFAR